MTLRQQFERRLRHGLGAPGLLLILGAGIAIGGLVALVAVHRLDQSLAATACIVAGALMVWLWWLVAE